MQKTQIKILAIAGFIIGCISIVFVFGRIGYNQKINDINSLDKQGITELGSALSDEDKNKFKKLLSDGADPNILFEDGTSVMSYSSVYEYDSEYLKLALKYGGDPNLIHPKMKYKPTPIFHAISSTKKENIDLLVEAGADLNFPELENAFASFDVPPHTPMMFAAAINRYDAVYQLLESGADYTIHQDILVSYIEYSKVVPENILYQWRQKCIDFLRQKGVAINPEQ